MGMATFTDDQKQIRHEFRTLRHFYEYTKTKFQISNSCFRFLSMGMSSDWRIAVEEGSNMIRIGSAIFGTRH
jgi:uncharacterized pyridoxal phosphate-containing UPF0001 family protein